MLELHENQTEAKLRNIYYLSHLVSEYQCSYIFNPLQMTSFHLSDSHFSDQQSHFTVGKKLKSQQIGYLERVSLFS